MLVLLTVVFSLWASVAFAAILYVDKDSGCPGSGTTGAPYCTITNATNVANPGDSIRIRDSASPYDESVVMTRSGSAGSPIIIEPDAGHNPTLRYTGNGIKEGMIRLAKNSYVTIQGLNFNGAGVFTSTYAIWVQSATICTDAVTMPGIKILNNTFQNWGGSGTQNGSINFAFSAVWISAGFCPSPMPTVAIQAPEITGNTFTANRHTDLTVQWANDAIVSYNTFTGTKCGRGPEFSGPWTRNAIGLWIGGGADPATDLGHGLQVHHNTFHDWEARTACDVPLSSPDYYGTVAGMWCDIGPSHGNIYENTLYNIDYGGAQVNYESIGIFIEAGCSGWTVNNNLIHHIGATGVRQSMRRVGETMPANTYTHNTIHAVGWHGFEFSHAYIEGQSEGPSVVRDNIVFNAVQSQIYFLVHVEPHTINNNKYFDTAGGNLVGDWGAGTLNFANWKTACGCDANSLNSTPSFVDVSAGNYTLTAGAPECTASSTGSYIGAFPCTAAPADLAVACYTFDGTGADSTGLGHLGILTGGAMYDVGKVGQALLLDGTNDYVSVASATDLNLTGNMSVDFWANLSAVTNDLMLFSKEDPAGSNTAPYHLKIANTGTPRYRFYQHDAGDFSSTFTFSGYPIPLNTWHHVAITRNATTEQLALWIDGGSAGSPTQTLLECDGCTAAAGWTDNPGSNTTPVAIGATTTQAAGRFLAGSLDELCLYNYVLTPAEIAARAARGVVGTPAPVIWRVTR